MKSNLVSVVVPAYNEEQVIGRLIQSIKHQSYKRTEIIVVDDGSNDRTVEIAKESGAKVFERSHAERSIQRNFGVRKSTGNYILILDADMELSKNVISECVEVCKKDAGNGAVVIPEKSVASNFWEKAKAFERSFYNIEGDKFTDAARFFTRGAFDKAGGYDETITGPEDWDLPDTIQKSGYKIARIKSIIYHYERITSPFKVAKKKYYYALKSYRYFEKQSIPALGPKTIYFLRPAFYKNWKKLISYPLLTAGMIIILSLELVYGGFGFFQGKFLHK